MLPPSITKNQLLANFDTFVFDADGVLWTGDIPIPGASQWINTLLDDPEKSVFITTNNSTKTLEQYIILKEMASTPRRLRDSQGNILNVSSLTPGSGITGGFSNVQPKSISGNQLK
ncbi:hypothetical protein L5515_010892 [Caenorhabditis briggsae]|uniref:Uncharacterized protein n=1 Tax=Caenorhabditis briggsae TaxID=6238 RepID=A0AAE9ENC1_CAEBR|nr:hypothetical protein L5515_010892 [Caenorhabditis briggsae]